MLAGDEPFKIRLEPADPFPPWFNLFGKIGCKLWVQENGPFCRVAVKLQCERDKAPIIFGLLDSLAY